MSAEQKLAELGLTLPPLPKPVGNYVPFKRAGDLIFLSGQGPRRADGRQPVGVRLRRCRRLLCRDDGAHDAAHPKQADDEEGWRSRRKLHEISPARIVTKSRGYWAALRS